ncbi:coiled-coil domain-containing protein 39 [Drosophila innubila]|uniref:coiled-coil domain-containing protein 39 n=1 Tax=Drosophila innubila TaxID=198719 RepID=UPI00148DB7FF|nr:coiled-coil domain-containing protein 39 [Drosophila innubila]
MYQVRRTSEFHEDAREDGSFLKKRQTRSQLRATITPMKKPSHRLTQPRITPNNKANGSVSSATPLLHRQGASTERAMVLHKDKKWVQEQAQLIAECLDQVLRYHPLPGISSDFFSRGAASIRQMTIKQFVTIVHFFLQLIFGNRINVGNNHVEEITNALHKLKYPYQVNKSWLVTPTTQHSFGHVMVMFDFLKDIALPSSSSMQQEHGQYDEFPFMETSEQPSYMQNTLDPVTLQISHVVITEETNHLLFPSAAESFGLWDTQNDKEYNVLKRSVSDKIIKCLCDLPDTQSLDADLIRLKNERKHLEDQLQLQADNEHDQLEQIKSQEEQLKQELLSKQTSTKEQMRKIEQLCELRAEISNRIMKQRKEAQKMQREVDKQRYTVEKFQSMKVLLSDLRNEEQFYKRQMQDFLERGNNQQVRLSRAKKQLLDKVEKFNSQAQNIGLDSDICSASEKEKMELVLPLRPLCSDIAARSDSLTKLATLLAKRRAQHEQRCRQLEQFNTELTLLNEQLQLNHNKMNKQIESCGQQIDRLPLSYKTKISMSSQHYQQLIDRHFELNTLIGRLQGQHKELENLVQTKWRQIQEFLSAAEQQQKERLSAKYAYIGEYKELLTQAKENLKEAKANVTENSIKLANFKLRVQRHKLPFFEEELEATLKEPK